MKISIALSILILAIGAVMAWNDRYDLTSSRQIYRQAAAEAAQLGIAAGGSADARANKRERGVAKISPAEYIAHLKAMIALGLAPQDETLIKRSSEMTERLNSLNAAELNALIEALLAEKDITAEAQSGPVRHLIGLVKKSHPQAALELLILHPEMIKSSNVPDTLTRWATDDSLAAWDWVRQHAVTHPELVTDEAKRSLIRGAAAQNPKLAFEMIRELDPDWKLGAIYGLMRAAKTDEQRTETLIALRVHLATLPDPSKAADMKNSAFGVIASGATENGYDAAQKWLATANLSRDELHDFSTGLMSIEDESDTGRWVEWLGKNATREQLNDGVFNLVYSWTKKDYQAAGEWLSGTPDGPAKIIAVNAYVTAISGYEPEVAAKWVDTLPPGKARETRYKDIHGNWPKDDPQGAAAFAEKHGIK